MLIIRKEQLHAFRQSHQDAFYKQLEQIIVEYAPDYQNMSIDDLNQLSRAACERAKQFEITNEVSLKRFMKYIGIYGLEFGNTPESLWARPVLEKWANARDRLDELDRLYQEMKGCHE